MTAMQKEEMLKKKLERVLSKIRSGVKPKKAEPLRQSYSKNLHDMISYIEKRENDLEKRKILAFRISRLILEEHFFSESHLGREMLKIVNEFASGRWQN